MRVLVVAPHPDDEAIGCGGRIRQHVVAGDEVLVLLMTQGELGCPGEEKADVALKRVHEAYEASAVLGSTIIAYWAYPDGDLDSRQDDAVLAFNALIAMNKPDVIYVTSVYDQHSDHRAAHSIVLRALEKSILNPEVWNYEVWTPMPVYDQVVDITEQIGTKLKAIRRHESQVNRIRFDEAALALARFRGELHNRPHGPYAEVFKRV